MPSREVLDMLDAELLVLPLLALAGPFGWIRRSREPR